VILIYWNGLPAQNYPVEEFPFILKVKKMTKSKLVKKYIPQKIINKCAAEAFTATHRYYDQQAGVVTHDYDLFSFSYENERHVNRVLKDVRAVLLGNRFAADLHHDWANRKFKFYGNSWTKTEEHCPTATLHFDDLSPEDRAGYELFVDTVWNTYNRLHANRPAETQKDPLRAAASKRHGACMHTEPNQTIVEIFFPTAEAANAFWLELINE
jgi:hypothetical protein